MQTTDRTARRTVARVEYKIHFGADSQVNDRNVVITPMSPARTDPFLLLSEDWFSTPGFDWHPHRGLETVTLVLDGVLEHGDNLGNAGALTAGDAGGSAGPALNYWPVTGTLITLEPGRGLEHPLPGRDRAFCYVLFGEVTVAGRAVRAGQVAWSDPVPQATASVITLTAGDGDQPSVVMVYSAQPIGQPVVMGGPFVMNTESEITQAFRDFRSGKFGGIPRQARLRYL
jgi:redox-sensitive bicupin YhaK (pirin superfamily)